MNLTVDLINHALNNTTMGPEILEYYDFGHIKLNPVRDLSIENLKRFEEAIASVIKNSSGYFEYYENQPLLEMEPNTPVSIQGLEGLYVVYCNAWGANDFFFFTQFEEAKKFAEKKYQEFLVEYKDVFGEEA